MKRFLLIFALCLVTVPVEAQQPNVITIIRDDGTKEVIELGGPPPAVPEAVQRPAPRVEVESRPVPQVSSEAPKVKMKIPPSVRRVAEPVENSDSVVPVAPQIKPTVKPKSRAVVAAKKVRQDALALIPPRKPHRRAIYSGEPITKDKALYIALSEAPPSRDVQVYQIQGEQGLEYSVLFRTDDGAYEVVVDAASGVIVSSGAVKVEQSYVKPGHLPARPVPY